MFDQNYYNQRKQELNQENLKNLVEAYEDILRVMQKSVQKTQEITQKFKAIEEQEKGSITKAGKKEPKVKVHA